MVWQERTLVIAMTTKIFANGFQKCFPYWRLNAGGKMEFGRFEIETISVERNKDYTTSSIEISNMKVSQV
jgi:hypothetical protein